MYHLERLGIHPVSCGQPHLSLPGHDLAGGDQRRDVSEEGLKLVGDQADHHRAYRRYKGKGGIRPFPVFFDVEFHCQIEDFAGIGLVMDIAESHPLETQKDVVGEDVFPEL